MENHNKVPKYLSARIAYWLDHGLSIYWVSRFKHLYRSLDLVPEDTLLDIGCGYGRWSSFFSPQVLSTYPMDLDIEGLRHLAHKPFDGLIVNASAEDLPYKNEGFSKVLAVDVIEHVLHDQAMIASIYRVVKPGGRAVLTTLIKDGPHYLKKMSFDDHVREYEVEELSSLLQKGGFNIQETFYFYYGPSMFARELQQLAQSIPLGGFVGTKILSVGLRIIVGIVCRIIGSTDYKIKIGKPAGVGFVAHRQ